MAGEGGDATAPEPIIRAYARRRMAERGIPEEAVRWVLERYHTRRPAPSRVRAQPAEILIGDYEGRALKVYIARNSYPPFVKTVVWEGED